MLVGEIPALAAHRAPDVLAVQFQGRSWTYAQMRDKSWQLGNALLRIAAPGDRIAILAENCPEYVLAYYGVPSAGMALTFLNYRLSPRELAWIIGNAEPTVLIVEDKFMGAVAQIRDQIPSVKHFVSIGELQPGTTGFDALLETGEASPPPVTIGEDDLAWLLYTSGTTGLPKGAMLSHRNVVAAVMNSLVSWDKDPPGGPDPVFMLTFPMYHVAGYALLVNHLRAVPVVVMQNFDIEVFFGTIERHKVTALSLAPTMIAMLLNHPSRPNYDLSSLRSIGYGASAMPAAVLLRARDIWPQVRFATGFGMTELGGNVMVLTPEEHDRAVDEGLPILNSVGRQMLLSRVRVVDGEGRDVAPGQEGEILVKGDQVLSGYWRNPEATEKSFVDGWFHTGDVGRWNEDRYLWIVDRKKDMIVTGGENVYPREVEEVLYKHPAVLEAAVIGAEDEQWGEEVVAVISCRAGESTTPGALVTHCREHIASYKKPRAVAFVDELPKNASGKVLKRELREWIRDGRLELLRP
ncbi:long-chain fatty acid--CoA ligase [Novosphingobium sp. KCTC 2891]|uniref:class I adenylate-forming enzyme family protein n=1 Tax=Novosphingobium sp. KCTC 2891 TaxID=2989730 RepID=UPI0022229675|nr:long-chain fatty acid--CoA ligase [Novosphingobium sp. KCTC 2891]MCW1383171.1 long-chain fatty acid--CoA ligase [Novosphingobium sp. KCTC 2891]